MYALRQTEKRVKVDDQISNNHLPPAKKPFALSVLLVWIAILIFVAFVLAFILFRVFLFPKGLTFGMPG